MNIQRRFMITAAASIGLIAWGSISAAQNQGFPDVSGTSPYAPYILDLQKSGAIDGDSDGNFHPADAVTRAEFMKLAADALQFPYGNAYGNHFADMNGHWAQAEVQHAWENGLISGVTDRDFAPEQEIKREEAAVIMWRYLKQIGVQPSVQNFMLPADVDGWATEGVAQVMAKKLYGVPFSSGTYQSAMTREEAAALVDMSDKLAQTIHASAVTPDGQTILEGSTEPIRYKDLELRIWAQTDETGHISTPNHSGTKTREDLDTPSGKGVLLTREQDDFTAASHAAQGGAGKTSTVYLLYVTKPLPNDPSTVINYVLNGLVTGDAALAKSEFLEIAKTWKVPALQTNS